ncbi:MAG: patatin-like phospholipase family protein [Thermoanaerobaculia bacterium]|nr:patatin-like phospholipase family protein [Thermoanaerobaculia bacterium]
MTAAARQSKIGIALAGGGLEGAIYEIGALRAIDEAFDGIDLTDLGVYVGVSAGAFIGSNLVNGITTRQQCRAIVRQDPGQHPFTSEIFLTPAVGEIAHRMGRVPRLLWESLSKYLKNPSDRSLLDSLTRLGRALPVGVFDNEPIRAYLEKIYTLKGRTDDFRELRRPLYVVAVDLDSGEAVRFGEPGFDHVPISRAVQASSALPGIYPPVEIDGRHYVDGALVKTVHASVALDAGADLVLCVNPIVPVDTRRAVHDGVMRRGKLIDRGWPSVISQTFRTLIHSRMEAGMARYEGRYGDAEVVLIEPRRTDYRMFFNNIFSFASRKDVCEHAYRATRRDLLERKDELAPKLARHGITLRVEVLADPSRSLWEGVGLDEGGRKLPVVDELGRLLDQLDDYVEHGAAG